MYLVIVIERIWASSKVSDASILADKITYVCRTLDKYCKRFLLL